MRSLVREAELGKAVADNRSRVLDTDPHAASLRSPSQSVRNPTTWFQLGVIGDASPEITNGLGAFLYAGRFKSGFAKFSLVSPPQRFRR